MGGAVQAQSKVGEGSTFWFTLPLRLDPDRRSTPVPVTDPAGLRALIVDDDDVNRRVVHEQISSLGMRNGSFASGEVQQSAGDLPGLPPVHGEFIVMRRTESDTARGTLGHS
jgi:hypothetical protein